MIKLVLFVVFLGLAYGASSIAQDHKQKDKGNNRTQTSQADKRGTESSPLIVDAHTTQSDEEAAEESRRDTEQNRVNGRIIALTLVIAICAGLQFCGIAGQIFVYRKQSGLMDKNLTETKKAADAALLNAQAVVASERPWLLIKPAVTSLTLDAIQNLSFAFTNHGKSPAVVLYTYFDFRFLPVVEDLINVPEHAKEVRFVHTEWVEPNGERGIEGCVPLNVVQPALEDFARNLVTGNERVWMWGGVRYQGPLRNVVYESKFCYMWTPAGQFIMGGPRGANECS